MSTANLRAAIDRFANAIINRTTSGYGTTAVQESVTLAGQGQKAYDLPTLLSGDLPPIDYKSAVITVKVLDEDGSSPTHNHYIDATAVVSAGVTNAGAVLLHNHSDLELTCYVRIDVPYQPS